MQTAMANFYPRSPRGERPSMYHQASGVPAGFLSTLPARGATGARYQMLPIVEFLSTLPARGATAIIQELNKRDNISIHAPREGSDDVSSIDISILQIISIHAPREGSDVVAVYLYPPLKRHFYPRSPRGERRTSCKQHQLRHQGFLSTLPARGATSGTVGS